MDSMRNQQRANAEAQLQSGLLENRRQFFGRSATGIGVAALAQLMQCDGFAAPLGAPPTDSPNPLTSGLPGLPHFAAKAKRVIYLFQSGAPSQMELFDHKPSLEKLHRKPLPDSIRKGQRLTGMTARQKQFLAMKSFVKFKKYGQSGQWCSDLIPHHSKIADDICVIKSMHTEAINHDPAITFFQTGHQQPGRPCLGSWCSYGLGNESQDLPAFVVLLSQCTDKQAQPLYSRLWGSGFLPSNHQGVKFRSSGDPVLYLRDPTGEALTDRRKLLDAISQLNQQRANEVGDPEIQARIAAYEMSYRMQM